MSNNRTVWSLLAAVPARLGLSIFDILIITVTIAAPLRHWSVVLTQFDSVMNDVDAVLGSAIAAYMGVSLWLQILIFSAVFGAIFGAILVAFRLYGSAGAFSLIGGASLALGLLALFSAAFFGLQASFVNNQVYNLGVASASVLSLSLIMRLGFLLQVLPARLKVLRPGAAHVEHEAVEDATMPGEQRYDLSQARFPGCSVASLAEAMRPLLHDDPKLLRMNWASAAGLLGRDQSRLDPGEYRATPHQREER